MNTLRTKSIYAVLSPNGDVWISRHDSSILIPREDCTELAKLLMWPVIGVKPCYKTDFSRCVDEPE